MEINVIPVLSLKHPIRTESVIDNPVKETPMKKLLVMLMVLGFVVTLSGCGGAPEGT
ncbi:MAG: hypothetical protein IT367_19345, partial [Candidatus Hydrogenedentes bacterium]|nr:hypothetical protein [Candidatus Hydrogenedentota bacterium]